MLFQDQIIHCMMRFCGVSLKHETFHKKHVCPLLTSKQIREIKILTIGCVQNHLGLL